MHAPAPETASPARPETGGPTALDSVDALRGYAILLVMFVHAQQLFNPSLEWLQRAASEGARGVQLFYIVSAYTLARSLLHRMAASRQGLWQAYAVRRLFRIVPLFYLIVLLNFLDLGLAPRVWAPEGLTLAEVFSALVFLNAWLPNAITSVVDGGWSVAVEANFYLLLPFVLMIATTRNRAILVALIGGAIGLVLSETIIGHLRQAGGDAVTISFFKFWLPYQLLAFGLGLVIYYKPDMPALRRPEVFWPLLAIAAYIFFLRGKAFPIKIACLAVFAVLVMENASTILVNRAVIFIGKISYSLYFLHFFVLRHLAEPLRALAAPLADANLRFLAGFLLLVAVSAMGATVTWAMIERPFIRLGGALARRIEGARA